MFQAVIL